MRPTFAYPGGKARLAGKIAALLCADATRFVDVFCGRGNVFFHIAQTMQYKKYWINDLQTYDFLDGLRHSSIYAIPDFTDPHIYRRMRSRVTAGIRTHKGIETIAADLVGPECVDSIKHGHARILHTEGKRPAPTQPAPLFEAYLAFSGGSYGKAGRRGLSSTRGGVSRRGFDLNVRLAQAIMTDTRPRITKLDYRKVLAKCGPTDMVYLDPPYLGTDVRAYDPGMLDHTGMVTILKVAKFKWVLSEYSNKLYTQAFGQPCKRWNVEKVIKTHTTGRNCRAVECIWKNY